MKLLISTLMGFFVGVLGFEVSRRLPSLKKPGPDFLTAALRRWIHRAVLSRDIAAVSRYRAHVEPLIAEVSLPAKIDFPLFLALQLLGSVLAWGVAVIAFATFNPCIGFLAMAGGAVLPYLWLKRKRAVYHTALLKSLPECLDLLALILEAGLDLGAGIQQYVQKGAPGPLRDLLASVQKDIHMGSSRPEALSRLAQKTRYAPVREVVRGLVQGLSLGTSLSPLLREQAEAFRTKRMQIAEKKAAEAPLKMLFPLFVFIFPTVFLVLFGPVVILFMRGGF